MIPLEHSKFQLCVKLSKGHRAIEYLVQTEERRDITLLHGPSSRIRHSD